MICLDSTCIIDFLKGKKEAISIVEEYKEEIMTTEINAFEVFFGIHQKQTISLKEVNSAEEFFNSIEILPFDAECGKSASKILTSLIKAGKMIDQNDALIASILEKNGIKSIITKNIKHFSNIFGLNIISY